MTPFLLLRIYLPFTRGKNLDSAFSTGLGAGRMGRRSPYLSQVGFCVLLNQIPGARQETPNKLNIKNLSPCRSPPAFTRAQPSKQCRDAKYSSWDVSASCDLQHLSLSRFLLFLIHVQAHFFMPRNVPDETHPTLCVLKLPQRCETPKIPRVTCQALLFQALGFALEVLQFSFFWERDFHKYV